MRESDSHYVHGTSAEEQRRLTIMNRLLNEPGLRELRLRGGERILDVGCGLAQFTRMMASAAGGPGRVVGVERDPRQRAEAARQAAAAGEAELVEIRAGDATDLPLAGDEWGSFDVVHGRFLLEHLSAPAAAVQQMVRAARPGGRVVLADDDHDLLRIDPPLPAFDALWRAYCRSYSCHGNDAYVGRKLARLLHGAGASPRRVTRHFFGGCAGDGVFPLIVENMIAILDGARETMIGHRLIDEPAFRDAVAALREWSARPDAAMWYSMQWAEGVKESDR